MEPRIQRLALPANEARLQKLVLMLLKLDRLLELKLTPQGIEVRRAVTPDEAVVPETLVELGRGVEPPEVALEELLRVLPVMEMLDFDLERHPLTTLIALVARVRAHKLKPACWFVEAGDQLDRFLGQDEGTVPSELFGVPVHYVSGEYLPEGKLVLVGSLTGYTIDAALGVGADIGGVL